MGGWTWGRVLEGLVPPFYLLAIPYMPRRPYLRTQVFLHHSISPSTSPTEAMLTGTESGQKREEVWAQGGGGSL